MIDVNITLTGFVFPMCRDAVAGHGFHFGGANLHFDYHAVHAYQYGVKGLIAIGFRNSDVILEFPGHRLENIVNDSQGAVAIIDAVNDQAKGKDIHNVAKRAFFLAHFAVDAP